MMDYVNRRLKDETTSRIDQPLSPGHVFLYMCINTQYTFKLNSERKGTTFICSFQEAVIKENIS